MRLFLFGSYSTGESHLESDVDIFITNQDLSGFNLSTPDSLDEVVEELSELSLENGGKLDLFIDMGDSFHSAYSDRMLFGKFFMHHLYKLQKDSVELSLSEIKELLSLDNQPDKVKWLEHNIFTRGQFIKKGVS